MAYRFTVNDERVEVDGDGMRPLALVLRDDLGLPGTKVGCFEGRCGACTIIVDGRSVVSCLYPLALADGVDVRTVEGPRRRGRRAEPAAGRDAQMRAACSAASPRPAC